jgi:hypothetical protein
VGVAGLIYRDQLSGDLCAFFVRRASVGGLEVRVRVRVRRLGLGRETSRQMAELPITRYINDPQAMNKRHVNVKTDR